MASFITTVQGVTPTTVNSTSKVVFGRYSFGSPIKVGDYNTGTYVASAANTNLSSGNTPINNMYVSANTVSINGNTAVNTNTVSSANCSLKLNFQDTANVQITAWTLYAYNGTTEATPPSGVTCLAAPYLANGWQNINGSANSVNLGTSSTANSHDKFVMISITPTSVGSKNWNYKQDITYQ
jgi:hypothetical protein